MSDPSREHTEIDERDARIKALEAKLEDLHRGGYPAWAYPKGTCSCRQSPCICSDPMPPVNEMFAELKAANKELGERNQILIDEVSGVRDPENVSLGEAIDVVVHEVHSGGYENFGVWNSIIESITWSITAQRFEEGALTPNVHIATLEAEKADRVREANLIIAAGNRREDALRTENSTLTAENRELSTQFDVLACEVESVRGEWRRSETKVAALEADKERLETIDIVFDSAPSNKGGRFIECEDGDGKSLRVGEWVHRPDGYWVLRLSVAIDKARESGGEGSENG